MDADAPTGTAGRLKAFLVARWRWMKPGLGLKRWILAICTGALFLILGAMFFVFWMTGSHKPMGLDGFSMSVILSGIGIVLSGIGIYRLMRRIEKILRRTEESRGIGEIVYQQYRLDQGPRLVCFGGGTGLSTLLAGLKQYSRRITAVVSVADDGGSSGRLRLEFDMLPPGDIRNCMVALSDAGPVMAELLQYRIPEGGGELAGHSFGNLFLTALDRIHGDFGQAIREANRILNVRGQVLPATLDKVSLVATHADGSKTTGQKWIAQSEAPITELSLKPHPGEPP